MNHEDGGFDCPGCAWPDDPKGLHLDICENGIKHVTWEMTRKRVDRDFFAAHTVSPSCRVERLRPRGPGPAHRADGLRRRVGHYVPISWEEAFELVGSTLRGLDEPEPGVVLHIRPTQQRGDVPLPALGARVRHEQPAGLLEHVPRGERASDDRVASAPARARVDLDDWEKADAIFVMGVNAASNAPRMLTSLAEADRRGAQDRPHQPADRGRRRPHDRPARVPGDGDVPRHQDRHDERAAAHRAATWRCCAASPRPCSRRRRPTRRPSTATFLDASHRASTTTGRLSRSDVGPSSCASRVSTSDDPQAGGRVPGLGSHDRRLVPRPDPAGARRRHDARNRERAPAARQHRPRRRGPVARSGATATSRATAPAASTTVRASSSWTGWTRSADRPAARARPGHRRHDRGDAPRRREGVRRHGRQLRPRRARHGRHLRRAAPVRADRPGQHQAQPQPPGARPRRR